MDKPASLPADPALSKTIHDPDGPQAEIDPAYLHPSGRDKTIIDHASGEGPTPAPFNPPAIADAGLTVSEDTPTAARYAIGDLLGSGATSHVYAAHDHNFDRNVAVKFLAADLVSDSRLLARFIREARITARVEHPNIAPVYDINRNPNGDIYLTMRQVSGMSLGETLRTSGADLLGNWNRVVTIVLKLCDALACAHSHGVVHRDIKPDNIMLGKFGEVVLVDWGAAQCSDDPAPQQRIIGTPAYMSPEQARGDATTNQSDIYSVGATLFHVLFGRHPTLGDDGALFWQRKRRGDIDAPTNDERAHLPKHLIAITLKALAPAAKDRYPDIAAFADDLRHFQSGQAISAYHDSAMEKLSRWHRQHWRILWLGSAALILAVAGISHIYGERIKEIAQWGRPLIIEDFTDTNWTSRWINADQSRWTRRDERLVSDGPQANFLFFPQRLHGAVAVEFDGELLSDAPPCDLSVIWTPSEPAAGRMMTSDAWWLQVGAHDNAHSIIQGGDQSNLIAEAPFRFESNRRYHMRFEIDEDHLTVFADGVMIMSARTDVPLSSGWVGLYTYYPGKAFDHVSIFNKGMAERQLPTAVGDAFVGRNLLFEAADAYQRVIESIPDTAAAQLAAYRRGLVLERLKKRDDALKAWSIITDPELAALVIARRIEWDAEAGHHDLALAAFTKLAEQASPNIISRLPIVVGSCINAAVQEANAPALIKQWAAVITTYLPHCLPAQHSIAKAFNRLDLPEVVVDQYKDLRGEAAAALLQLGRYKEVLDSYRDQPFSYAGALSDMGRFGELERDFGHMHFYIVNMLVFTNRTAEAIKQMRDAGRLPVRELLFLGEYGRVFPQPGTDYLAERIMDAYGTGKHDDARDMALASPPTTQIHTILARCGLIDDALARTTPADGDIRRQLWAFYLYDALDRKQTTRVNEARAALKDFPRRLSLPHAWLEPWLLTPLSESPGDAAVYDQTVKTLLEQGVDWQMQRPWHLAALLAGQIEEAAFLSQPCQRSAPGILAFARGLRAERQGDRTAAASAWHSYLALPLFQRDWDLPEGLPAADRYAEWRLHALEVTP